MTHILVRCQCGAKLQLGIKVAGKVCRCPKCETEFTAPDARMFGIGGGRVISVKPVWDPAASKPESGRPTAQKERQASARILAKHQGTERSGTAHSQVRETIGKILVDDGLASTAVASALALAAHPWPNETISQLVLDAIAAEMLPARNLHHYNVREVAIDRLLRIAESLQHESAATLVGRYAEAADVLQALDAEVTTRMTTRRPPGNHVSSDFLLSPFGIGVPLAKHDIIASDSERNGHPTDEMTESIAHLLGLAAATGSKDIGLVHGDEPTGFTVEELARKLQITLPLECFDRHLANLNSRERDILVSRSFVLGSPDTLEDVASRWKVTRERVRQLEVPLKADVLKRFATPFSRLGRPALNRFTRSVEAQDESPEDCCRRPKRTSSPRVNLCHST